MNAGNSMSPDTYEQHIKSIDHNWKSLPPKCKSFLLEHKTVDTLTWDALMQFWSQPEHIHTAQMAVTVGTCHLLALEFWKINSKAMAAILACTGAFLQQCIVSSHNILCKASTSTLILYIHVLHQNVPVSFEELQAWPAEKITKDNLPHFHDTRYILSSSPEFIPKYLARVLPLRYQKMLGLESSASHVPGMGYVDLISRDWNNTAQDTKWKNQRYRPDEEEIKIILLNEGSGCKHEKTVKPGVILKSVFNEYADECGESLRSFRFSHNGSTLFLSSLGQETASDIGIKDLDVISICNNASSKKIEEESTQQQKNQSKKIKSSKKKSQKAKGRSKAPPRHIAIPQTEKELKEAHSLLLSKVHEEAEPVLKEIRQRLNTLVLDCKKPKSRRASSKKQDAAETTNVFNPDSCGLGGKAGRTSFAVKVGQVENLYISSKRNSIHSRSSMSTRSSVVDLHGCSREEAIERLDSSLIDWMDTALKGEYPWVIPATIVCGGGNQIISETVETWIKSNKNVANAPRGSLLC